VTTPLPSPRGWTRSGNGIAVFLAAGAASAALNAGFQRLGADRVDVDDLGALNALLAVVGGVGLLGLGLQVVLVRAGAARLAVGRAVALVAVVTVVAGSVATPGPTWYRLTVGLLLAAAISAVLAGVPHRARLLADASWRRLAAVYLLGACVRLVALLPLLALIDNHLVAAMVATAAGETCAATSAWLLARPQYRGAWSQPPRRIDAQTARVLVRGSLVLGGLWMLTIADTVVARLHLAAAQADAYSLSSTAARSSFFLAVLLAHLALPTFMLERGRSQGLRRAFAVTIVITSVGSAVVATVMLVVPRWSAQRLLGADAATVDTSTLRLLVGAWAVMSVLPLLTYFHLDRHPRLAALPGIGALVIIGMGSFASSGRGLATTEIVVVVVCVVAAGLPAFQRLAPVTRSIEWADATGDVHARASDVTVVVPFFNPGPEVLVDTVGRLAASLRGAGISHRVIAVSDGSTDGSAEALRLARFDHVDVVVLDVNVGKGGALRAGLALSRGTLVGYIDADGDLPPEQVVEMVGIASQTGADAVVGSKVHPASHLDVEGHRRGLSLLFRVLVRVLFRLDVRDTQTGLKLYRGDVVAQLVPLLREDGFAIDVEILVAAMRAGHRLIVEAPVHLVRAGTTTMSISRGLATIGGLLRIFWRDHVALAYEAGPLPMIPVVSGR
jgi:hypothetical protein